MQISFSLPKVNLSNLKARLLKISPLGWIVRVFLAFIIAVSVLSFGVLRLGWEGRLAQATAKTVPLPIAVANGKLLFYRDYRQDVLALRRFFEKQKSGGAEAAIPDDLESQIFERMIKNKVTNIAARERGIKVNGEDLGKAYDETIKQFGAPDDALKLLNDLYGWDRQTFENKVLRVMIEEERLAQFLATDEEWNAPTRARIEEINRALKDGADFAALAKEKSEDPGSAAQGGDLGFFSRGVMVASFEEAAFAMKPGETSEVVQSPFGFHIIKVVEVKKEKGEIKEVRARHILVRAKGVEDFLNEKLKVAKIYRFLKPRVKT